MTQELISNKKTEYETIREMEAYLKQIEEEGEGEAQPSSTAPPDNREPESPQVLELTSGNKKTLLVPLEYVQLSMHQFREEIDWSHVDALAEDIAMHGLEYPIVVYALGQNNYVVKDGEHRFHAVKKLGWKRIPAQVIIVDDGMQADLDAARLNLLRKEYDRKALFHVVQVFTSHGYSQNWIAKTFNLRKSKVNLYARLSRSETDHLKQLKNAFLEDLISEAHAETLMKVLEYPEFFLDMLFKIIQEQITSKQLTHEIKQFLEDKEIGLPDFKEEQSSTQKSQQRKENVGNDDSWESIWSNESQQETDEKLKKTHELQGGVKGSTTCMHCGRSLTAPESVKLGIGPVCALHVKNGDLGKIKKDDTKTIEQASRAYEYYKELGYYSDSDSDSELQSPSQQGDKKQELTFTITLTPEVAVRLIHHIKSLPELQQIAEELESQFIEGGDEE